MRGRVVFQLSAETAKLVRQLRPENRKRIFGGLISEKNAQKYFRKIVKRAGLVGSTKWLRRSGATYCEAERPGTAPAYLGHKGHGLAYVAYVDPALLRRFKPRPPKIG